LKDLYDDFEYKLIFLIETNTHIVAEISKKDGKQISRSLSFLKEQYEKKRDIKKYFFSPYVRMISFIIENYPELFL
jgi:hypothetical protein